MASPLPLRIAANYVMPALGSPTNSTSGAKRLVDGVTDPTLTSGVFYASAANKLNGPMVNQADFFPDLANPSFQDQRQRGHPPLHLMTSPRPGDAFHLNFDGAVIAGRYIGVDRPHHMLIEWDRPGTDNTTPTPTFIEFTFTPTGDETTMQVQLTGLSREDAALYLQLFAPMSASTVGRVPNLIR